MNKAEQILDAVWTSRDGGGSGRTFTDLANDLEGLASRIAGIAGAQTSLRAKYLRPQLVQAAQILGSILDGMHDPTFKGKDPAYGKVTPPQR